MDGKCINFLGQYNFHGNHSNGKNFIMAIMQAVKIFAQGETDMLGRGQIIKCLARIFTLKITESC